MAALFTLARFLHLAYKVLRTTVGILLVANGTARWLKNKRSRTAAAV